MSETAKTESKEKTVSGRDHLDYFTRQAFRVFIALIGYFLYEMHQDFKSVKTDVSVMSTTLKVIGGQVNENTKWREEQKAQQIEDLKSQVKVLEDKQDAHE